MDKMNVEEFRKYGKEVIDYICEYGTNIEERDVAPTLDPGYLKKLLPGEQNNANIEPIWGVVKCLRALDVWQPRGLGLPRAT